MMPAEPSILDVQVTDLFGNTKTVTWVVRLEGGGFAKVDLDDGRTARTDAAEFRDALEPRIEEAAA